MVVPPGVTAKHLAVKITSGNIQIGIKGNPPYLNHDTTHPLKTEECFWTLEVSGGARRKRRSKRERAKYRVVTESSDLSDVIIPPPLPPPGVWQVGTGYTACLM